MSSDRETADHNHKVTKCAADHLSVVECADFGVAGAEAHTLQAVHF